MGSADLMQQIIAATQGMAPTPAPVTPDGRPLRAPWESLPTAEEESKAKMRRIAEALAAAGGTLASTPGDFLQGLGAAVPQGAQQYHAGEREADEERRKREGEAWTSHRGAQGQNLTALRNLFSTQHGLEREGVMDARYRDDKAYARGRDTLTDDRYTEETGYARDQADRAAQTAADEAEFERLFKVREHIDKTVNDFRETLLPSSVHHSEDDIRKAEGRVQAYREQLERTMLPAATGANTTPPQLYEVRDGFRYNGGDPGQPTSWTQVE